MNQKALTNLVLRKEFPSIQVLALPKNAVLLKIAGRAASSATLIVLRMDLFATDMQSAMLPIDPSASMNQ